MLRFMTALKAARDFGMEPELASAFAIHFNPTAGGAHARHHDQLVDALASALVDSGAVTIPDRA